MNNDVDVRSSDCISNENATFSSYKIEVRVHDFTVEVRRF